MNATAFIFYYSGPKPDVLLSSKRVHEKHVLVLRKAAGPGLEPRYSGPKPDVLPLDDPAALRRTYILNAFLISSER